MVMIPLMIQRVGFGFIEACVGPVLNYLALKKDHNIAGAVNGYYFSSINLGVTVGK